MARATAAYAYARIDINMTMKKKKGTQQLNCAFDLKRATQQTFRLHSKRFYAKADTCCDLLICDEAHRLKNADTATNQVSSSLIGKAQRRFPDISYMRYDKLRFHLGIRLVSRSF